MHGWGDKTYFATNFGGLGRELSIKRQELLTNTTRPSASASMAFAQYQTGDDAYIKSDIIYMLLVFHRLDCIEQLGSDI